MDSGFHLLDSRSFSVELGFRIRIVSGIPDSYTCIPDSKAQDSGFHKQKFPRFWIPNAKISRIPESGFLYMGRKRDSNCHFIALTLNLHEETVSPWKCWPCPPISQIIFLYFPIITVLLLRYSLWTNFSWPCCDQIKK